MPNIVIKEIDATSAGRNAASTDVVFVPGFADTNANVYILTEPGSTPDSKSLAMSVWTSKDDPTREDFNTHLGGDAHTNPQFAVNTTDKLMWVGGGEGTTQVTKEGDFVLPTPPNNTSIARVDFSGSDPSSLTVKGTVKLIKTISAENLPTEASDRTLITDSFISSSSKFTAKWSDVTGSHETPVGNGDSIVLYASPTSYSSYELLYDTGSFYLTWESIAEYGGSTDVTFELDILSVIGEATSDTPFETSFGDGNASSILVSYTDIETLGNISRNISLTVAGLTGLTVSLQYAFTYTSSGAIPAVSKDGVTLYFEPYSENAPVLCSTIAQFEENFGTKPYEWRPEGSETEASEAYSGRRVFPEFTTGATPTSPFYAYKTGDKEKSYVYAAELINAGLPVLYYNVANRGSEEQTLTKALPKVTDLYNALGVALEEITDKSEYAVKYITSGGYPTYELTGNTLGGLSTKMQATAENRGDAVAIIDHTNNPVRPIQGMGSVYETLGSTTYLDLTKREYSTMFTPWYSYTCIKSDLSNFEMPASYGYLMALAKSIVNNANWLAIAGVSRGLVPNYIAPLTTTKITNKIADTVYQPRNAVALNAITNIKPYGDCIWGNRTLITNSKGNLTAHSFLNVRNLVSDIKKQVYITAKRLIFEQNSDVLWINFIAGISPLLDQMVSGQGIKGYKIIKGTTDEKAKVVAQIRVTPIYPVEDFDITIVLTDDEVSVS